ncbi:MAG: hypothetical protein ACI4EO_06300 [Blautia sp.]
MKNMWNTDYGRTFPNLVNVCVDQSSFESALELLKIIDNTLT